MDIYDDEPTDPRLPKVPGGQQATTPAGSVLPYNEPTVYPAQATLPAGNGPGIYDEPTFRLGQAAMTPTGVPVPAPANQAPGAQKNLARRKFMGKSLAGLVGGGAAAVVGGVALAEWLSHGGLNGSGHAPVASSVQIGHLLRRAGFGASASDVSTYSGLFQYPQTDRENISAESALPYEKEYACFANMSSENASGYQAAVDRLLNYQHVDDSAMEQRLQALNLDLSRVQDQQRWWLLRMAWTQRPLLEKMTLFWSGVLTSSFRKVGGPKAYARMINQNNFLRAHAFDTFDNILLGITADPAMLFYLDLTKSTKKHPNENYARELMELFTVGVQNYTQQDVFAGAAALTGWHIRGLDKSYYNPNDHNTLPVKFMGKTGSFTYKDILHILADHPAAPWFIGRRLFAFFAYENPSNDDLKPLVDAYVQSGHNMGAVMKALLLSPQFSSAQAYRSRVKSPIEFTVGAYRALGIQGDGQGLPAITTLMGQPVFDPPNVAGWPGDKVSSNWLNSGAWMTRLNYIDMLLARGATAGKQQPLIDLQGMVDTHKLSSPETFVDHFSSFLLDGPLPAERRSQVLDYFTASGNASRQKITLSGGKAYPLNRVRGALYLIMASPEYQLN